MAVGVERLGRARVPQPRLDGLDRLAVPDEQTRVEVPQRVEGDRLREAGGVTGPPEAGGERAADAALSPSRPPRRPPEPEAVAIRFSVVVSGGCGPSATGGADGPTAGIYMGSGFDGSAHGIAVGWVGAVRRHGRRHFWQACPGGTAMQRETDCPPWCTEHVIGSGEVEHQTVVGDVQLTRVRSQGTSRDTCAVRRRMARTPDGMERLGTDLALVAELLGSEASPLGGVLTGMQLRPSLQLALI
jgi:hypothetical protein